MNNRLEAKIYLCLNTPDIGRVKENLKKLSIGELDIEKSTTKTLKATLKTNNQPVNKVRDYIVDAIVEESDIRAGKIRDSSLDIYEHKHSEALHL